jgi:hypothetical protein
MVGKNLLGKKKSKQKKSKGKFSLKTEANLFS